jgi:hypothetical protein
VTDPTHDSSPEEKRVEELLLRSARLDVPGDSAKRKALDAGLAALGERRLAPRSLFAGGIVIALAAAAALWVASRPADRRAESVTPERVSPSAAPKPALPPAKPACPRLVVARGDAPLLEDWEEQDSRVASLDGRGGNWITYDDGTGKQTPPDKSPLFPSRLASPRGSSARALHLFGGKFTNWGVTFGAELADAACYDASEYAGVSFVAKGPGVLKVGFQMLDVQDVKYGGLCKTDCYNAHRKVVELSKSWKEYSVRWEELHQLYEAGPPLAFDPSRVRFLEFSVAPEDTPFDLWVDDVRFVKK